MSFVTEFIRGLIIELTPIGKWTHKNWLLVAICLITIFLIVKYRKKRKP
jgi:hypothetical protein